MPSSTRFKPFFISNVSIPAGDLRLMSANENRHNIKPDHYPALCKVRHITVVCDVRNSMTKRLCRWLSRNDNALIAMFMVVGFIAAARVAMWVMS